MRVTADPPTSRTDRRRRGEAFGPAVEAIAARECPSRGTGSPFGNVVGSPPIMNAR